MNYPVFIYHELVLRFSEINREIGRYISNKFEDDGCLINTTSGWIKINQKLLEKQYTNPKLISDEELQVLAANFHRGS